MLDSTVKILVKETSDNIAYIRASVKHSNSSSLVSTFAIIFVMLLYQLMNISQFRELKNEIKALKNPAVSAEITIDKPAESR